MASASPKELTIADLEKKHEEVSARLEELNLSVNKGMEEIHNILRAQSQQYSNNGSSSNNDHNNTHRNNLGHVITKDGVFTDPTKIQVVANWPIPTTIKQLRGFLGLAGYYQRFVKNFGEIGKPLTNLMRNDGFIWSPTASVAFQELKTALTIAPVLALPNFTKTFIVEADAYGTGIGVVLCKKNIQ
ncbi:hypothetical protein TanjilG_16637 [Lupinus angustifolius]|uniref:Reverse transcriptase/retrotransposon-derived protein RNase H-like domain-containing protein n=1 Tax=Lupinus angustifolius TaxID=3871 RepID=A0A4P1QZB0_LUPAN|nr:hypothetical protein TanjilG_16637 [Lupinus angustifolius]